VIRLDELPDDYVEIHEPVDCFLHGVSRALHFHGDPLNIVPFASWEEHKGRFEWPSA
jgi:hypothetical protein